MARLSDDAIARELARVPEWERAGDEIVRTIQLSSFPAVIALVDQIAALAEAADHHPDIDIRYRTIRLALTTHAEGGLTGKDFEMAGRIEALSRSG